MSEVLRVGLIGLGFAAWELKLPGYEAHDDVRVVAVADPLPAAREEAVRRLGLDPSRCFADYRDLLALEDVDFVDVSTPHCTHVEIVIAAAAAGKGVLCDKPLATTLAEADLMIGACERAGVTAGIFQNFEHFPSHDLLCRLIAEGAIGRPTVAVVSGLGIYAPGVGVGNGGWRLRAALAGGGILVDYGIHATYLGLNALGGMRPRRVSAYIDALEVRGDVEDTATVILDCAEAHAAIHLSWGSGTTGETAVHGTEGSLKIVYPGGRSSPHNVAAGVSILKGRDGEEFRPLEWERFPLSWYYGGSVRAFADSMRGSHQRTAPTLSDGRSNLEVVLAAYKSAALGVPVELPLSPSDPVYQRGALGVRDLELPEDSVVLRRNLFVGEGHGR